jgi:hypothetical protein
MDVVRGTRLLGSLRLGIDNANARASAGARATSAARWKPTLTQPTRSVTALLVMFAVDAAIALLLSKATDQSFYVMFMVLASGQLLFASRLGPSLRSPPLTKVARIILVLFAAAMAAAVLMAWCGNRRAIA